jgi:sugar lactone lactonase YvrE
MSQLDWELVVEGFGRLEAPCFDLEGRLCFVEGGPHGRILRIEPDGSVTTLLERAYVGGLLPHADGGLLVSGHTVSVIGDDASERVLLEPGSGFAFNDLTSDAEGRVFVGRFDVDPHPPLLGKGGSMWRIGPVGATDYCYDGIQLTNGVGVSPDGTSLYHNDTTPRIVWTSELTEDGMPINLRPLHIFAQDAGGPDGMAVDEAGCIWIALIGSGTFARLTPDGKLDQLINSPQKWTASLCFGGTDGRDLYAVTFGGEPYELERSGGVYRARAEVGGSSVYPAKV